MWTATYVLAYLEAVALINVVWISFDEQTVTYRNTTEVLRRLIITIGNPKEIRRSMAMERILSDFVMAKFLAGSDCNR